MRNTQELVPTNGTLKRMGRYQIIYADPPWRFRNYKDETASRWVGEEYPLMTVEDICKLPVGKDLAAEDAVLFLWVTAPCLPAGLKVIEAWGFQYKTVAFTWVKRNKVSPSWFWGMGYWTRSNAEFCLLATKGKPKRESRGVHQIIDTAIEQHSKKPDMVRDRIVQLMGDVPRIELFARTPSDGWDVWGNEVESDIQLKLAGGM